MRNRGVVALAEGPVLGVADDADGGEMSRYPFGGAVGGGVVGEDDLGIALPSRGYHPGQAALEQGEGVPRDDDDGN